MELFNPFGSNEITFAQIQRSLEWTMNASSQDIYWMISKFCADGNEDTTLWCQHQVVADNAVIHHQGMNPEHLAEYIPETQQAAPMHLVYENDGCQVAFTRWNDDPSIFLRIDSHPGKNEGEIEQWIGFEKRQELPATIEEQALFVAKAKAGIETHFLPNSDSNRHDYMFDIHPDKNGELTKDSLVSPCQISTNPDGSRTYKQTRAGVPLSWLYDSWKQHNGESFYGVEPLLNIFLPERADQEWLIGVLEKYMQP